MTADGTYIKTCPLCEAMCGLKIRVEGGKVTKIRPNEDDVWSQGYICPKGTTLIPSSTSRVPKLSFGPSSLASPCPTS